MISKNFFFSSWMILFKYQIINLIYDVIWLLSYKLLNKKR